MKKYYNVFSGATVTLITDNGKDVEYKRDYPIPSERTRKGEVTKCGELLIFTKKHDQFHQCYNECAFQ